MHCAATATMLSVPVYPGHRSEINMNRADNRKKELRPRKTQLEYGKSIVGPGDNRSKLPRQLGFVAFQYLATNIEPFSENVMSRNVLKNLLKKDIVVNIRVSDTFKGKPVYIYEKDQASDKFVLILQGTVEVIVGNTNMVFESGPFSHYGVEALTGLAETPRPKEYIPDFSVRVLTDVQYLFITQSDYLSALHATRMMRQSGSIHLEFGSDVDRVKSNHNQNGTFSNNSPPYCNSSLSNLKDVDANTKRSTSSLDRLAFFQRKPDPHEILSRMWRTGSDAKERSDNYHHDPRKHSMDSSHHGDSSSLTSPRKLFSDGPHKRWPLSSSQPFKTSSNHKLDYLMEDECGDGEKHDSKRTPLIDKSGSAPQSSVLQAPPIFASLAEGESSSIASAGTSPRESALVDTAVSVHASPGDASYPQGRQGAQGPIAEQLEMNRFGAGDTDKAPLVKRGSKELEDKTASVRL
ncbi:metal transporter CNNM2 [Elysia marginata]|uniref:Metal transporter CNNM2 n=1 Tax=Elysia marginata TaxID=1093978 RepID=A0AAV4I2T2_9GAST|nr:metal transporter CNNM2 [Elysia marginata]